MVSVGYSPNTARAPSKVTKSIGFTELLDTELPDDELVSVHKKLLNSGSEKMSLDALALAYKVKGKLAPSETTLHQTSTYNTFVQNNQIDPNTPSAKELVDASLNALMELTRRKVSS